MQSTGGKKIILPFIYFYFSLFLCFTVSVEVYNWLILPGIIRVQLLGKHNTEILTIYFKLFHYF